MQQAERRRFARTGRIRRARRSRRARRRNSHIDRLALRVVGEAHVGEDDVAFQAAGIDRARPVGEGRREVEHGEEIGSFGTCIKSTLAKPTSCSSRATSMVAKLMKVTISPTVARPWKCSHVPRMKMTRIDSVAEARVATVASAHHDRTGNCAASSCDRDPAHRARFHADARETLHDGDIAERVRRMFGERGAVLFDLATARIRSGGSHRRSGCRRRRRARSARRQAANSRTMSAAAGRRARRRMRNSRGRTTATGRSSPAHLPA